MAKVINIDGNIGAGKTTFIHYLIQRIKTINQNTKVCVIQENVDKDASSRKLLDNYYLEPKKYALQFQKWILDDKLRQYRKIISKMQDPENTVIIFDRSFMADYHVFCSLQHQLSNISNEEFLEYQNYFTQMMNSLNIQDEDFVNVYLVTSVDNCYTRIIKRSRPGEKLKITKEYLRLLEEKHEIMLKNAKQVVKINGNGSIEETVSHCESLIERFCL